MDNSATGVETEIPDLRDVSLTTLAFGHDSDPVVGRVAGKSAIRNERARRRFNSSLSDLD